jgi:hypothetical protein
MNAHVFFYEEANQWIVESKGFEVRAKRLYIDGKHIDSKEVEDIIVGHITKIIPKGVVLFDIFYGTIKYEAEEVYIYTLPYLLTQSLAEKYIEKVAKE